MAFDTDSRSSAPPVSGSNEGTHWPDHLFLRMAMPHNNDSGPGAGNAKAV